MPPELLASLRQYAIYGVETGGMLRALLSNDLFKTMSRADLFTVPNIRATCQYVWNCLPAPCWGSEEKVSEWIKLKRETRGSEE